LQKAKTRVPADDPMFESFVRLAEGLIGELSGVCLLDGGRRLRGCQGEIGAADITVRIEALHWQQPGARVATLICTKPGQWLTAVPLEQTDGTLLGIFCIQQALSHGPAHLKRHPGEIERRLKPLLDCIRRELVSSLPSRERIQTLSERTAELEWLFKVTSNLQGSTGERHAIEELLAAATQRLDSAMGVLEIPDKQLCVEYARESTAQDRAWNQRQTLHGIWRQTRRILLGWAQRRNRPLVINSAGNSSDKIPRCKILSVPVALDSGRVIGFLAFYNPPFAGDFSSRHEYLARHLGRQAANVVHSQFDLMTGLYTRGGLAQAYGRLQADDAAAGSLLLIDIDRMHVVNELHGFELGNELIVRIADLLSPPLLPGNALRARLSGDRFAIIVPGVDARAGMHLAEQIQAAARDVNIGPAADGIEASISCGVADLVAMPQGFDRCVAAAEIACKTAKSRGRDRIAVYASDDQSMMQRHGDAIALGRLRAALKSDRLLLYAERIKPLKDPGLAGGYQLSLRLREETGGIASPQPLLAAAQRYQLLPSVDRFVVQNALRMLAPFRGALRTGGFTITLNLAGQSLADAAFVDYFRRQLRVARLPAGCLLVTLGETVAARQLAAVSTAISNLHTQGVRFGLDGFGVGTHALDYIRQLRIGRVAIGGEFVRETARDGGSQAAVRAIVELAGSVAIETVAEGVDQERGLLLLRELGVDFARGAACGAPAPLEEMLPTLGADESRRLQRLFLEL